MDKKNRFAVIAVIVSGILAILVSIAAYHAWTDLPQTYEKKISRLASQGEVELASEKYEEMRRVLAEGLDRETRNNCEYALACGMYDADRFEEARLLFSGLGEFKDSSYWVKECSYAEAIIAYNQGGYEAAAESFRALGQFSDSPYRLKLCRAAIAEELYQSGELSEAITIFRDLGDHPGAAERAYEIAYEITGDRDRAEEMLSDAVSPEEQERLIALELARQDLVVGRLAAGRSHSVALRADGTVLAVGNNEYGQCDVEGWTDIVAVSAGAYFTLGLRADGTVVAAGRNEYGQCDVGTWTNVRSIAANDYDSFAVTEDGQLLFCGYHDYADSLGGNNIVEVYAGAYQGACRLEDGTVITSNLSSVTSGKPASVALSTALAVSLMWDGTLSSDFDRIPQWENIIALAMNARGLLGLTAEGEVKNFFFRESDAVDLGTAGAEIVAISAGGGHYLLLDSEGRVHAFGDNSRGQCDTQSWRLFAE